MEHHYAIYNPYGLDALNFNGNQANRLYRYNSRAGRDKLIQDYPTKATAIFREQAARLLAGKPFWEYEAPGVGFITYMDR